MPTLIDLDGFAHQSAQLNQSGSGFAGIYDAMPTPAAISFDTSVKRLAAHAASLKVVESGAAGCRVSRTIAAGKRLLVASFYFRATSAPAGNSQIFRFGGPVSSQGLVQMNTDGTIRFGFPGQTQTFAGNKADGVWHRIDIRVDTSGTTYLADCQLDGVAGTQASIAGQTAVDQTSWILGSNQSSDVLTFWAGDLVVSETTGDYPIGEHMVLPLYPNGDGTHSLGTTNPIVNELGTSATPSTRVDDWNGGLPNTTDYVTYTSTTTGDAASNFAEFTFDDPISGIAVVDVLGIIAGFANGTGVDNADVQVLTAHGGTLIDHIGNLIDYSGSATVLGYFRQKLARPSGGWDATKLAAVVAQWGRSTDTNAIPRLSAIMLEYAATVATQTGAAALTGTGGASATGLPHVVASATISAAGAATAAGVGTATGTAALTGSGAITAAGLGQAIGTAALTGAGAITSAGVANSLGSAALTGSGALAATAVREQTGAGTAPATGGLTAVGMAVAEGVEVLAGLGGMTVTGTGEMAGAAALQGTGAQTTAGTRELPGTGALTASGALVATGGREPVGTAALVGTGSASATGSLQVIATAAMHGTGTAAAAGNREALGTAALEGSGDLDVVLNFRPRLAPPRWQARATPRWRAEAVA